MTKWKWNGAVWTTKNEMQKVVVNTATASFEAEAEKRYAIENGFERDLIEMKQIELAEVETRVATEVDTFEIDASITKFEV